MRVIGSRPRLVVSADGKGVVGHAGAWLLADLADATGLTRACSNALRRLRPRGTGHDLGRIATDLALMIAGGGEAITDVPSGATRARCSAPWPPRPRPGDCSPTWTGPDSLRCGRQGPRPGSGLAAGRRNRRGHTRGDGRRARTAWPGPGHRRQRKRTWPRWNRLRLQRGHAEKVATKPRSSLRH
jgi:hypothetical protein